jgi:hypothetical protein
MMSFGYLPMICIDPLSMAGAAEWFQTEDMGADEGFGVLAPAFKVVADASEVRSAGRGRRRPQHWRRCCGLPILDRGLFTETASN